MKTMKTNSNNKWDEMRSQLAILNDKIENETIVDDRHIRHSMKNKVAWIHRYVRFEIFVLLPLLLAAGAAEYCIFHFSMGFVAFALFFIAADVIFDYIVNTRKMSGIFEGNLIVARRQLIEIKRLRTLRIAISIPFTIIFILWLIYEVTAFTGYLDREFLLFLGIGLCVGAIFATVFFRSMQQTNNALIRQIDELTSEERETPTYN